MSTTEAPAYLAHVEPILDQLKLNMDPETLWTHDNDAGAFIDPMDVVEAMKTAEIELPDCNTMVQFIEDFDLSQSYGYSTFRNIQVELMGALNAKGFIQRGYLAALAGALEHLYPSLD